MDLRVKDAEEVRNKNDIYHILVSKYNHRDSSKNLVITLLLSYVVSKQFLVEVGMGKDVMGQRTDIG